MNYFSLSCKSIFNIDHGTPILYCITTDLGIFWYCFRDSGVAFVRALLGMNHNVHFTWRVEFFLG